MDCISGSNFYVLTLASLPHSSTSFTFQRKWNLVVLQNEVNITLLGISIFNVIQQSLLYLPCTPERRMLK
ncbi:hypothetical protein EGR_10476 [Echinococcus granulosus]|uniref:Uncharacterized protein n=1 Tax=Echinococcus granulosus TaxID=6210 RepID=W6U0T9_ECHGR|nr:hypothetical protein EGR_10476 [Echinococcus granulosus]EUB54658.1 hypothetical protein EGR_10476 [Echinococcus granulosus]